MSENLAGFAPEAVSQIRTRLDLARADGARILFAIESGSRAWGFPSPDSDYDCRFIYVRTIDDHLVLRPQRDVIEFPIEGDIDAGGWDLRKALLLALKGNAVISEWARSPHVYEEESGFRADLLCAIDRITPPALVARHYYGLLVQHEYAFEEQESKLKKLFYALRPALALHYMDARGFEALPPMDIDALIAGITLPADLKDEIEKFVALKRMTREMGTGQAPALLLNFLRQSRDLYATTRPQKPSGGVDPDRYAIAEDFYRQTVAQYGAEQAIIAC